MFWKITVVCAAAAGVAILVAAINGGMPPGRALVGAVLAVCSVCFTAMALRAGKKP